MKKIQIFCDICDKEFQPQEYSFLTGQVIKINNEFKQQLIPFEGHYCGEDTQLLLEKITELKNAHHKHTGELSSEPVQEGSDQ